MVESDDPEQVLGQEEDACVRAAAEHLWACHVQAERTKFLDEPPEPVRQLHSLPSDRTWRPGARLSGRFVVLEFLGEGGMGEVYLAHDERLHDRVALKTIRKELLDMPDMRERLAAEVQNARKVTHPNVCRIYDIHDDGGVSFFAMEYLQGETLAAVLEKRQLAPKQARTVAVQLADALHAAHEKSIMHRDFKPGNVILTRVAPVPWSVITDFGLARAFGETDIQIGYSVRGGTPDYMAPELLEGAPATIQSDLYAYGKVLAQLLPGHTMVGRLTDPVAGRRPLSMVPVIESLKSGDPVARWTRRGLLVTVAGAAAAIAYLRFKSPHVVLGSRQRVILNGFHGNTGASSNALAIRNLLLLALEQSPFINVFPDRTLVAALRKRRLPLELPAKIENLREVASQEGARLIIDGAVRRNGKGLTVDLDLFVDAASRPQFRISEGVADARQMTRLAEISALKLRQECGESAGAIRKSYSPLERATSAVPEAVEYYFEAVQAYEQTHAEEAIGLLDKAISLDDEFALAHFYRGLAQSALFQTRRGFKSCERAFQLRARTTPRERTWIESQYYNLAGDRVRALDAYKQNAYLYPEDGVFQRQLAYGYALIGQFDEALKHSYRAVELDPFSVINRSELVVNLAEAMRYDEAIAAYQDYLGQGLGGSVPNWGAGLAYLGKRQYETAQNLFGELERTPEYSRWARLLGTMAPILEGELSRAAFQLQADIALDVAVGEEFRLLRRRAWLGWTQLYRDDGGGALSMAQQLAGTEPIPNYIFAWRDAARLAAALGDQATRETASRVLRKLAEQYPSTYLSGVIAGTDADWALRNNDLQSAEKNVIEALGLLPDPLTLLTAAAYFRAKGDFEEELVRLRHLDAMQGRILKHEWPGWIPVVWFQTARCLIKLGRPEPARPFIALLQQTWGRHLAGFRIGEAIRALSIHLQSHEA